MNTTTLHIRLSAPILGMALLLVSVGAQATMQTFTFADKAKPLFNQHMPANNNQSYLPSLNPHIGNNHDRMGAIWGGFDDITPFIDTQSIQELGSRRHQIARSMNDTPNGGGSFPPGIGIGGGGGGFPMIPGPGSPAATNPDYPGSSIPGETRQVPEPATLALVGLCLVSLVLTRRKPVRGR
ncbi:PEP-CTERM sorting domain-containing protein [Nitrosomonas sp. ANs5]|uniref:PEP-CTERM sorting domain-containing protein n=1 Tax=Nitrosomonas sp. ANs5 TaxID=3423941 RepID=UPI003D34E1A2